MEKRITPQELEIGGHFKSFYSWQEKALEAIKASDKKTFLLDGPPGTGKSLIGIAAIKLFQHGKITREVLARLTHDDQAMSKEHRCVYLTATKQLQSQIQDEFEYIPTVMGRNNFPCPLLCDKNPDATAEDCIHSTDRPCPQISSCPYRVHKQRAVTSPISTLNYAYFLAEANNVGQFSNIGLVIVDEVDSLEKQLMSHIQLSFSESQLAKYRIPLPKDVSNLVYWMSWADETINTLRTRVTEMQPYLRTDPGEWSTVDIDIHRQSKKMESFMNKLRQFIRDVNDTWIFYKDDDKWIFKPIKVNYAADEYLWRHAKKTLGMSGTVFNPAILADGVGITNYDYLALPSPFPVENRPIYYTPVANLTYNRMTEELPKLTEAVRKIISTYPNKKLLVHTCSYEVQKYLLSHLSSTRVVIHNSDDREDKLDMFKDSLEPLVMLSPSFDRGVDLPNETNLGAIIICKVPYLSLADRQVAARLKMPGGQEWYNTRTAQTIVQMSGRGVRKVTDRCDCFVLDKQFTSLLQRTRSILPAWWLEAIQRRKI